MQDESLALDRGGVAGDPGRDMDLKARGSRRPRHRQAMRYEIPVFGNEIENLLRHQMDSLCRRDKTISMRETKGQALPSTRGGIGCPSDGAEDSLSRFRRLVFRIASPA